MGPLSGAKAEQSALHGRSFAPTQLRPLSQLLTPDQPTLSLCPGWQGLLPCWATGHECWQATVGTRKGGSQAGLVQSSMASSWSARASNMVLMSSRMCLVEAAVGLHREKALTRWAWACYHGSPV